VGYLGPRVLLARFAPARWGPPRRASRIQRVKTVPTCREMITMFRHIANAFHMRQNTSVSTRGRGGAGRRLAQGALIAVLDAHATNRAVRLSRPDSRILERDDVFEVMLCNANAVTSARTIDSVGYLGFVEVSRGGLIEQGDFMELSGRILGTIAGFDTTHAPNHLNVVVAVPGLPGTGRSLKGELGARVRFRNRGDASSVTSSC